MNMKRALLLSAMASAMLSSGVDDLPNIGSGKRTVKKSPMSNKQKKARNKSKRAKKARKWKISQQYR
jgi:hypothetical protein